MINEEQTIANLKKLKSIHNGSYGPDIDSAIKALEQQPCDAISREAVIKHLENITMDTNPDHYDSKDKWYQANGFNLCKVGIEMYVKNLSSVTPKARWIPCSERLPKKSDYYLVTIKIKIAGLKPCYVVCSAKFGRFENDFDIGYIGDGVSVIAWMPLIQPYKEDEEE